MSPLVDLVSNPIECRGDPRDIGFDQGVACRADLQARYARSAGVVGRLGHRLGRRDAHTARVVRDVVRHFPHQAESLEGAFLPGADDIIVAVRGLV